MFKKLAVLLVVGAAVSACGSPDASSDAAQAPEQKTEISASRTKDYNSLAELKSASTLVVRAKVESAVAETLNEFPVTVSTVKIHRTLFGVAPAAALPILQLGDATTIQVDTGKVLEKGREYLLFLEPYHLTPGDNTGKYVIVGGQGVFELDGKAGRFVFAGGGKPALPAGLPLTDVESANFLK